MPKILLAGNDEKDRGEGGYNIHYRSGLFPITIKVAHESHTLYVGDRLEANDRFDEYQVINESALEQEIDLQIGSIKYSAGARSVAGPKSAANYTETIPAVVSELVPANGNRRSISITPDIACYIGSQGVSKTNSKLVLPGQTFSTTGTFAIHAVGESGQGGVDGVKVYEEMG